MQKMILFGLLTLLIIAFIWGSSLKPAEVSKAQSTPIVETLQPVLDPDEKLEEPVFHAIIRKMAHVIEFFLLGLSVAGFFASSGVYLGQRLFSMPVLVVLLVAVTDEFIQHFSNRGSLVTDVVLDFGAAMVALAMAWLGMFFADQSKKRGAKVNG